MATVAGEPGTLPDRINEPEAPVTARLHSIIHCAHKGYLVGANHPLSTDPSEHDVAYLPTIGCSRLVCLRCQSVVRNAPGLAFKTRNDVATATLSAMYDLPDLLDSNLIHRTEEVWRLYLCRCDRYLAVDEAALESDDPDDSPGKPWRCDGHPFKTLPEQDVWELTRRGLRGEVPSDTREADRENNYWLLRLHHRLEPPLAASMAEIASRSIADAEPSVRSASLRFLFFTATDAMRELVVSLLKNKRELLKVPVDTSLLKFDTTLEDTAWHVVSKIVGKSTIARDYAREEALAGHGSRALYSALAEYDCDWLLANLEVVARNAPGRAGDLISSFNYLPDDRQSSDHATQIRRWLIAPNAPLDAIRNAAKDHVPLVRRNVPLDGAMKPVRLALPDLEDGTELALEIMATEGTGRERLLNLHIKTPGGTVVRQLGRGPKIELISRLQSADIADLIMFQTNRTNQGAPMTLDTMLAQPGPLVAAWDLQDDRKTLRVYRVATTGAKFLDRTEIAADEREVTNNKLSDRGLRIGYTYSGFIWVLDDVGVAVWSERAQLADGTHDEIRVGNYPVSTNEITRIEVFVAPDNMGHRGVQLGVAGRDVVVAEENFSFESNPTYSQSDLDWELNWAEFLGRDLALWLRRPYADRHGRVTNRSQLDIYVKCCEFADMVSSAKPSGEFEQVLQTLGPIEAPGNVVLRFAANSLEDEGRFVEQKVFTPSGKSWYGRWLKLGTNRQIAAFLRDVRTPATIMANARELRRRLVEDDYA